MKKMDIIYEDKELLVVNKPPKLLTISDGKTDNTLYNMARSYVKKQHKSNKIFIVHRLDKDTSGVVLFAKSEDVKKYLQDNWNKITKREYLGILDGYLENNKGVIKEYLLEDKTHRVYASNKKVGEYAETHYEVLNRKLKCTLVKIEIRTGKKNQIRVGFSNLGHPIIGDKKYGSKNNYIKRLGLHASRLEINIKDKKYVFEASIPKEFLIYQK
jgi:RluA family pseudouridine synthase